MWKTFGYAKQIKCDTFTSQLRKRKLFHIYTYTFAYRHKMNGPNFNICKYGTILEICFCHLCFTLIWFSFVYPWNSLFSVDIYLMVWYRLLKQSEIWSQITRCSSQGFKFITLSTKMKLLCFSRNCFLLITRSWSKFVVIVNIIEQNNEQKLQTEKGIQITKFFLCAMKKNVVCL